MALGFLKKKKNEELPLPPPPSGAETRIVGDLEPIRPPGTPELKEPEPFTFEQSQTREPQFEPLQLNEMPEEEFKIPEFPSISKTPELSLFEKFPIQRTPDFAERMQKQERPQIPPLDLPELEEKTGISFDQFQERTTVEHIIPDQAFIAVEDYQKIINNTNAVRARLLSAETIVKDLNTLKSKEETAFDVWRKKVEEVEKKISYIDNLVAQAQK
ncbi:hypothetical protein COV18_01510 [Candidatus Woesearchaeota archaeon CG10_big_fil_rev_8_21_14_0_10_37_12]|nr:MAG: hypothetical protein COV18_01510 [Candidatus Woesearchaeota archaeon CG10_big_fil_rev_8_21_14_0_10_37_12]